jgi:uroporphyrinogen-III synthase
MGGTPYYIPTIEIRAPRDLSPVKEFIEDLVKGEVDYVVFMSVNGVRYLLGAAEDLGMKTTIKSSLEKTIIMAVGPRTAEELEANQIHVSLVPAKYTSEGILERFQQLDVAGKRICIPRTPAASPALAEKLRSMGALVKEVYVYESGIPADNGLAEKFIRDLAASKIHAVVFGSSLCVTNLFRMLANFVPAESLRDVLNKQVTIVAIGPVTAETLGKLGVKVDVMPRMHLFEEALGALAKYWNENNGISQRSSKTTPDDCSLIKG